MKQVFLRIRVLMLMFALIAPATAEDWQYTVQPGDTIWDISHDMLKDWRYWDDVVRYNKIRNVTRLRPGTKIAIPLYIVREESCEVRVDKVQGEVEVVFANREQKLPLKPGMALSAGDRVLTGENSTARFILDDGSIILLQENSELEFTRMNLLGGKNLRKLDARIKVHKGRMKMEANPSHTPDNNYEIITVSANAAVRGTRFRVGVEEDSSRTEVLDGKVSVSNDLGQVLVPENFGTVSHKDRPPMKPVKLLPPPDLRQFPELLRYLPKVVVFPAVQGVAAYRVQIARDADFMEILMDRVVKGNLMLDQRLPDGLYHLRVRAVDANGLEGHNAVRTLRIDARPEPPMVRAPLSDKVLHAGPVSFSWADVEGVDHYLFELARKEDFVQLQESRSLDGLEVSMDINEPGEYFFRVSSVTDDGRQGPPGKAVKIRVLPVPASPEPEPPAVEGKNLRLAWQAVEGIASYQVQLASDAGFQDLVFDGKTSTPWIELPRPPSGYYHFRLRSIDGEGYVGAYGTPQRFEVQPESYVPLILFVLGAALLLL